MTLDYALWQERDAVSVRWLWEVVDVTDDGEEIRLAGGIELTREAAMAKIKAELRKRR
jgi:hypothetical protein